MKIESYEVLAGANRTYLKEEYERVGVSVWNGAANQTGASFERLDVVSFSFSGHLEAQGNMTYNAQGQLDSSTEAKEARTAALQQTAGLQKMEIPEKQRLKMQMLSDLLYAFTGRRTSVFSFLAPAERAMRLQAFGGARGAAINQRAAGIELVAERHSFEHESVQYQARGVVNTADGKSINIDMMMNMSRTFAEHQRTSLGVQFPQGNASAIDPLVINYGGTAASLTGEKFEFDLDFDGVMDQISFAGPGSGFLALDKNGDGTINDGSELFGPGTGNGFGELRGYDLDGNGWIDENDDVFSQLTVWSKDSNGNDQLFRLKDLGIGAIYLGDTATEFTMGDAQGNAQGTMRSTSFFLKEDGGAGFVHHIDLMV